MISTPGTRKTRRTKTLKRMLLERQSALQHEVRSRIEDLRTTRRPDVRHQDEDAEAAKAAKSR
jgi:hypothetical protein